MSIEGKEALAERTIGMEKREKKKCWATILFLWRPSEWS
jgi:hypothetical protein